MSQSIQIPRHIVLFGRPGSGKSSLAERLNQDEGYLLVRTGEMLREAARKGGPLGSRVDDHLKRGELVPDQLILELLESRLVRPEDQRLLFDGFPRTPSQLPLLEQFEEKLRFHIDCYLEIELSREVSIRRMTGRRVCPKCGATYHLVTKPPRVPDRCDADGEPLVTRTDDSDVVIAHRQKVYDDNVPPIIAAIKAKTPELYRGVNGDQAPDAVYAETRRTLGLG